jgi:hypothetical protein
VHEGDVRAALAPLGWDVERQAERDALGIEDAVVGRVVRVDRGAAAVASASRRATGSPCATGGWRRCWSGGR